MSFCIYHIFKCPRCKHYVLNTDPEYTKEWRKMGWCKYYKQDVRQDPGRGLKNPGKGCDLGIWVKRSTRGIASAK